MCIDTLISGIMSPLTDVGYTAESSSSKNTCLGMLVSYSMVKLRLGRLTCTPHSHRQMG